MSESPTVLFVDDEAAMRAAVGQWLGLAGFRVQACGDGAQALARLHADFDGVLVTDLKMPGMDGIDLLRQALALDADLPVVVITGHGGVEKAVEAMRLGAYDFIEKPFAPERFVEVLRRAAEKRRLTLENRRLRREVGARELEHVLLGTSTAAQALRGAVAELAAADVGVVLVGETGTGKDLVARCLHDFGPRRDGRYVAINCAAVPESMVESELFGHEAGAFTGAARARCGKLEHAHGGTLFLDEIESMPLAMQAKMLRALQERSIERLGSNRAIAVDARVIAASKRDLREAGARGEFRADLYYRLSVVELRIPPLRERPEDIALLFEFFASSAARAHGREPRPVGGALLGELLSHPWPGNVRELRNAAERHALGLGGVLLAGFGAEDARPSAAGASLVQQMECFERQVIERALAECGGRIHDVMAHLDLPRRTLNEKMARYGLERARYLEAERSEH
ncbi:sigma-54-dependent Fis family transcriptional regulator [Pseudothauera nasutitermitis]|uniref:Sigma-54-dependent Fis family transcriptional regulator n=1 Tax=Pseudothauera nasutitermitis TaxID=2565930 RepID=A0A4V3WBP4_9RHOO|nr:sigma-54 dependent transcriptional regulator [Pseudothauera nasutitermitis]THF63983.1 sigma-54-dependent Fis family transcriptional regulator [Pseudothauera nasutitermitis]